MNVKEWLSQLSTELDLDAEVGPEEIKILLDVARDAAHGVERLAAPLTTYLLGLAVGRGADLSTAATRTTELLGLPQDN